MGTRGNKLVQLDCDMGQSPDDAALIAALLAIGNGDPIVFVAGTGAGTKQRISAENNPDLQSHYGELLLIASRDRMQLAERIMPTASALLHSLKPRPILHWGARGYRLDFAREFRTIRAALDCATVLLLDIDKPFGAALCRCQLSDCGRFYLATKNSKGGPANRHYCEPSHRTIANNRKENRTARKHK